MYCFVRFYSSISMSEVHSCLLFVFEAEGHPIALSGLELNV